MNEGGFGVMTGNSGALPTGAAARSYAGIHNNCHSNIARMP